MGLAEGEAIPPTKPIAKLRTVKENFWGHTLGWFFLWSSVSSRSSPDQTYNISGYSLTAFVHKWWAGRGRAQTLSPRLGIMGARSWIIRGRCAGAPWSFSLPLCAPRFSICKVEVIIIASWGHGKELYTVLDTKNMGVIPIRVSLHLTLSIGSWKLTSSKITSISPSWSDLVEASFCKLKCFGFDSWSGHEPTLQVRSQVLAHTRGN